jgi:hypothetical protein
VIQREFIQSQRTKESEMLKCIAVVVASSLLAAVAFGDQKMGQQSNPPPPSQSDRAAKYCHEVCTTVSADGTCVHYENVCN